MQINKRNAKGETVFYILDIVGTLFEIQNLKLNFKLTRMSRCILLDAPTVPQPNSAAGISMCVK